MSAVYPAKQYHVHCSLGDYVPIVPWPLYFDFISQEIYDQHLKIGCFCMSGNPLVEYLNKPICAHTAVVPELNATDLML